MSGDDPLERSVFVGGSYKRFGALTREDVQALATELGGASGLGHRSRVGSVAAAWQQLGSAMNDAGAGQVGELDQESVERFAQRLWIVPPDGGLLPGGPTPG
jgi:hypothetical protein